jgi:hypothetical protein
MGLNPRFKNKFVDFIPLVIGATGAVTTETKVAVGRLEIDLDLAWLQKIAAMETVNIFRSFL